MYKLNDMRLSNFRFELPQQQIAQFPYAYREDTRLMVVHTKTGEIEHKLVKDTASYFEEGDMLVFNDTATFPARIMGVKERTSADIEILLLRELKAESKYWDVLVEPARKIRIGNKIVFEDDPTIVAEVIDNTTSRGRTLRFLTDYTSEELRQRLHEMGSIPVPRYIRRPLTGDDLEAFQREFPDQTPEQMDVERYQSIFAKHIGAVALPASSAQFSKQQLKRLEIRGVEWGCITSHVNLGNTKPVDVEDLNKYKAESEQVIISRETADKVNRALDANKRVCAVGAEVFRVLEDLAGTGGHIKDFNGWTNKFIYPPYIPVCANAFFCNFYFPLSMQQLMVVAFGGPDLIMRAYEEALKEGYRFGDYGDAMLVID